MALAEAIVENFGRNLRFEPRHRYAPRSEAELLSILQQHRGAKFRALGRRHSWSPLIVTDDVLIDMRHFDQVQVEEISGEHWATVGAGCQIKRILSELERQANVTLPTLGLISEQAIAGAAATGTHGSGRNSLSHYLSEVRIAHVNAAGEPAIRTITGGAELLAARCSLGCLGIVISVRFRCRPAYRLEEHLQEYHTLDEVLAQETDYPLQQFYLIPWRWRFLGQHRRESAAPRSRLAGLYRWYWFLLVDLGLHLTLLLFVRGLRSMRMMKTFFRWVVPLTLIQRWRIVDYSPDMLIMEHELFRHLETEIFVPRSQLPAALQFVREVLEYADGNREALSSTTQQQLSELGLLDETLALCGVYTHHYVICVRSVQPDDTLLSASSGRSETSYAISLITYEHPTRRDGFFRVSKSLVHSMARLFGGRPHWGKHCALDRPLVQELYPRAGDFAQIRRELDPSGAFLNRWTSELFEPRSA